MKTKHLMRSLFRIAMIAFLVLSAGNAFAIDNKSRVVSPYWQVDTESYSFIAVTHSSLSGMNSQIGIKVTALDNSGTSYGTAASFTINSGTTQRLFIVPTSHTTINPTSITASDVAFIRGTSDYSHGSILVEPISSHPERLWYTGQEGNEDLTYPSITQANGYNEGFRDATMLTYWGSVVVEANTTGFAMEFIGDMNDSMGGGSHNCEDLTRTNDTAQRTCIRSGVNLQ